MAYHPKPDTAVLLNTYNMVREFGKSETARLLDVPLTTVKSHCRQVRADGLLDEVTQPDDWQEGEPAAEFPIIPSQHLSYDELKERSIASFNRLKAHKEAAALITVRVKLDGPYGIMVLGDPHIDDNGADWPLLDRHTQLIRNTEGLFGANVGDVTNNWIGRLARLYADQSVTRTEAIIMTEGWLREVRWLWIDPGNHDMWSGADDPIKWVARLSGAHYKWQGSRLALTSPNGFKVIVNSRHDHPGHSMYHATHGPLKAAIFDSYHDDIYTCGHKHSGAYLWHPHNNGRVSHLCRLSSYKIYDSYADDHGFHKAHLPAAVFIIDPSAADEVSRVTFFADPERGADVLRFLRARHNAGKRVAA